jgi:hypothetical protein
MYGRGVKVQSEDGTWNDCIPDDCHRDRYLWSPFVANTYTQVARKQGDLLVSLVIIGMNNVEVALSPSSGDELPVYGRGHKVSYCRRECQRVESASCEAGK